MTDQLFVYGTLMRAAAASRLGRDMRERLERSGAWLGTASIEGRLYDLGRYPLLKPARSGADLVHGEVYRLSDPAAVFAWLDPYEGIEPGAGRGEYERVVRPVTLTPGATSDAWVYLSAMDVPESRRLASGRWRPASPWA